MRSNSLSRRGLLRAGFAAGAAGTLVACSTAATTNTNSVAGFITPDSDEVRAREARRKPGPIRDFQLIATTGQVDLGGRIVTTWTYGGQLPGKPIRVQAGEVVRATLTNHLPQPTTIHWRGLAGDTAFRVALGGHTMTVTHTDGFPIQQISTDALLVGIPPILTHRCRYGDRHG